MVNKFKTKIETKFNLDESRRDGFASKSVGQEVGFGYFNINYRYFILFWLKRKKKTVKK